MLAFCLGQPTNGKSYEAESGPGQGDRSIPSIDSRIYVPNHRSAMIVPPRENVPHPPPKDHLRDTQHKHHSRQKLEVHSQSLPLPKPKWPAPANAEPLGRIGDRSVEVLCLCLVGGQGRNVR